MLVTVKEEPRYSKSPVVMVDEVLSSSPPKFSFPEAGLRVMITNKFGPRTRLRMASRIIINEVRSREDREGGRPRGRHVRWRFLVSGPRGILCHAGMWHRTWAPG